MTADRAQLAAQVRAMRDTLEALGLLMPPADVPQVSPAQAQQNAQHLARALSDAAAQVPSTPPALGSFRAVLTLAGAVLAEAQRIEPRALAALGVLMVWASDHAREVLGAESAEQLAQLDSWQIRAAAAPLGESERGVFLGADTVLRVSSWAAADPDVTAPDLGRALLAAAVMAQIPGSAAQA